MVLNGKLPILFITQKLDATTKNSFHVFILHPKKHSSHIVCKPLELILREVNITHVIYPLASIVINDRCLLSFSVMQI